MAAEWLEHLRMIVRRYIDPGRYEWRPTVDPIPVGREEMLAVYGDPDPRLVNGKWVADPRWERLHCHTVSASLIPGYHRRIYMHRLVSPHFKEGMKRAVKACPDYEFRTIGCFNVRRIRYDTPEKAAKEGRRLRPWSIHYAAAAFDFNRHSNKAFHRQPTDPLPFEVGWGRHSDLPQGVVLALESVGFEWGGRWGNGKNGGYCDPMHFQLVRT